MLFSLHFHIISGAFTLKISNALTPVYFLGFPCTSNVFAIVQALSLGAEECPRVVLLYGFEFQTCQGADV